VPEYLTIEEAADLLRTTPNALRVQRHRRSPPGTLGVLVGRRLLFQLAEIDAGIAEERRSQLRSSGPEAA
jgi:hypothetical protein